MEFKKIKSFRFDFFSTYYDSSFYSTNGIISKILNRANLLLDNKIIFDDPLDMEPCLTAYLISDYKWNKYPGRDPEWGYMLNRQGFLVDLAISYKITGREEYFLKYKELLFDFILTNGVPTSNNKQSWRSMDVGIRLQNLIKSFTYINIEDLLSNNELKILKQSILIHIDHLEKVYLERYDLSNWGVLSLSGLATVDIFFPELIKKDSRAFIWEKISKQLELQFYNDGVHWEQSPLYHHQVVSALLYLELASSYLGIKLPVAIDKKLERPICSSYFYANNNDMLVPLNDSDRVNFSYVYNIYRHMGYLKSKPTDNESLIFVGSLYQKQKHNIENNHENKIFSGKNSGFYAYKKKKLYFTMFNGLHGSGHGHASQGSFTLDINNKPFIVDSGRYTYTRHLLRFKLRKEAAHNSVSVRGFPATKTWSTWGFKKLAKPLSHSYHSTQFGPLFSMSWSGRGPGNSIYIIQRTILYLEKFNTFIFYDNIKKNSLFPLKIKINFNLSESVINIKKNNKIIEFYNDEMKIKLWSKKGVNNVSNHIMSKIYNQKNKHKRISNSLNVFDSNFGTVNSIIMDSKVIISKELVYDGSNSEKMIEIDNVEGIKLNKGKDSLKIYFLNNEVAKGVNYYKSSNNEIFYGLINVIDQTGQVFRLK